MKKTLLIGTIVTSFFNANAAIVYTDIADETLSSQGTIDIDFNGDQTPEFTISDVGFGNVEPGCYFNADAGFIMLGDLANGGWDEMAGVSLNTTIDVNSNFANNGVDGYIDAMWNPGTFPTGADTYIGATFKLGANTHYGWIRVNWDANGTLIVKDMAYNDLADASIDAGDEGGSSASISMNELVVDFTIGDNSIEVQSVESIESITLYNVQGRILGTISKQSILPINTNEAGLMIVHVKFENNQISTFKFVR